MLPSVRRKRIVELLEQNGAVKISHLSQVLSVSEMTIHRDLNSLGEAGVLRKVRGGAVMAGETAVDLAFSDHHISGDAHCPACYATSRAHTQVVLHCENGTHQRACCPHCGLIQLHRLGDAVGAALVTDFISGQMLNAQSAVYVVNPDVAICCTPTTISFRQRQDAERFQLGFGGEIMTMRAATSFILDTMKPSSP